MIGQTLGHYRITEKIGAGGMGEVYRARDERLDRDVALKLLPPGMLGDETAKVRLLQEARMASKLNHPHICTIHEVGEADGQAYIVMEYLEGRPLRTQATGEGLPIEMVIRYGAQVAEALAYAHDQGIIHGDIKSSNVVSTSVGRAKVLDFGLARRLPEAELSEATCSRVPLEEADQMAGTLHYLAPEALRGELADARRDLWALGVLLFELASGELPFKGQTMFELTSAIFYELPRPLPARVPAGLRAVILRCLAKEPGQRYRHAGEVQAALEALLPEAGVGLPVARARRSRKMLYKVRPNLRVHWKALVLIALGVIAGGVTGGVAGYLRDARRTPSLPKMITLTLFLLLYVGVIIFWLKRWTFVVYPDKIRVQGSRRRIDIRFDQIESVQMVSYQKKFWWAWKELQTAVHPRYPKLGEAHGLKLRGWAHLIQVKCQGLGWRHGYYLDTDQPERFLHTLNRALERYRAKRASGEPVKHRSSN